jgi:hypothetical protein
MKARHVSLCVVALVVSLACAGCLRHRFGDARLQSNSDAVGITKDRLLLPPVPLDRPATHTLQVRNLPLAIYPTHILVPLTPTDAERRDNFPWAQARVRVEFRTLAGQTFFSNQVALASAERGRSPGTYHQLTIPFRQPELRSWRESTSLPRHTSYDVVVTVLEPSKIKNQRAILFADTYVR